MIHVYSFSPDGVNKKKGYLRRDSFWFFSSSFILIEGVIKEAMNLIQWI